MTNGLEDEVGLCQLPNYLHEPRHSGCSCSNFRQTFSLCKKTGVHLPLSPLAVSSTPLPWPPPGTLPIRASQLEKLRPCSFFLSNSAARHSVGLLNRAKIRPLCPFNTGGIRTSSNGGPRTVSPNVLYGADRLSLSCLANSELISWINVSATNQLWATVTLTSHCLLRHGWLCKF